MILPVRDQTLLPPAPAMVLAPNDHVHVVVRPEDRAFVQLLFGRPDD